MIDFVFKYLMLTGLLIELIMIIAAKQRNQWTFGIIYCLCLDFQLLLLKLVFVSYHMLKFAKKKNEEILTYFTLIITPSRFAPSFTFPCYPVTYPLYPTVDTTVVLTVKSIPSRLTLCGIRQNNINNRNYSFLFLIQQ